MFPLPTGYVQGPDGAWQLDPDAQVRERLGYVFEVFRRAGGRASRPLKARGWPRRAWPQTAARHGGLENPDADTVIRSAESRHAGA